MTEESRPEKPSKHAHVLALEPEIALAQRRGLRWLRYPPALEAYYESVTGPLRSRALIWVGLLALVVYDLFAYTDQFMVPDVFAEALTVRFLVVTPVIVGVIVAVQFQSLRRIREWLLAGLLLVSALGIVKIMLLSKHPNVVHYHGGVVLVVLFCNIVIRLRFWLALPVSLLIFVIYSWAVTQLPGMPYVVAQNVGAVLGSAVLLSLVAAYQMEYDARRMFLLTLQQAIDKIRLQQANRRLSKISSSDALTGLANRRQLDHYFRKVWRQAARNQSTVSVIYIDIDHFKAYNDTYGHPTGDVCLRRVAETLQENVNRGMDMVSRYGGEEFVILLPDTASMQAKALAERLRMAVAAQMIEHRGSDFGVITISLGVAGCRPSPGDRQERLLALADEALYRAKVDGRNRVHVAGPSGPAIEAVEVLGED